VENVRALFQPRVVANNIEVEIRTKAEIDVTCMPGEAQQIFANLIGNAIEAMPHGGRLTVRLRPSFDWRDGVTPGMRVTFVDSGMGLDRPTMRRIFEPFFTTKIETGTGLGLWVVAQLVERHRGQVRVWSRKRAQASGTAFSVFLPLNESGEPNVEPASPTQKIPALGTHA
jgi:two-component system CheB/CheR fusion protein